MSQVRTENQMNVKRKTNGVQLVPPELKKRSTIGSLSWSDGRSGRSSIQRKRREKKKTPSHLEIPLDPWQSQLIDQCPRTVEGRRRRKKKKDNRERNPFVNWRWSVMALVIRKLYRSISLPNLIFLPSRTSKSDLSNLHSRHTSLW